MMRVLRWHPRAGFYWSEEFVERSHTPLTPTNAIKSFLLNAGMSESIADRFLLGCAE